MAFAPRPGSVGAAVHDRRGSPRRPRLPVEPGGPSLFDALVDRIAGQGPPAHRVWLPPLAEPPTLDEVLGPPVVVPGRGLMFANPELHGALQVPVAVVDRPLDQRRDLLWFALDGAAGHVAVVGAPRSGKSTALRTLVCGLALAHTPAEARFYCLDFGGGALASLRDLPHVGGVASRLDPAEVRRTVGELSTLLAERERHPAAGSPHVFLVVDGWSTLRTEFDDLEPLVTDLAGRGPGLRHPRPGLGQPLARPPPGHPRPVRRPPGAAPRRPERLDDLPAGRRRRARRLPRPGRHQRRTPPADPPAGADRRRAAGQGGGRRVDRTTRAAGAAASAGCPVRGSRPDGDDRPDPADRHRGGRPAPGGGRLRRRPALRPLRRPGVRQIVVPARPGHHRHAALPTRRRPA